MSTPCLCPRGSVVVSLLFASLVVGSTTGCFGGSHSRGRFDRSATLLAVTFPDPNGVDAASIDTPPRHAPLVQQVVLTFSGRPDPNRVNAQSVQVRGPDRLPVDGTFVVADRTITFTPRLPTRPAQLLADGSIDDGGAGLRPATSYTVEVGAATFPFVSGVAPALLARFADPFDPRGVLLQFTTTSTLADFFAALPIATPRVTGVDPRDGEVGVSPNLYADPDHLFAPRRAFFVAFDRALRPDFDQVGSGSFELLDLDDRPSFAPGGLLLGADVALVENELDHALVRVTPSGILPFGHLLALEIPTEPRSLSDRSSVSSSRSVATTFTIAAAPIGTIRDELVESFDANEQQDADVAQLGVGTLPANWNERGSGVLEAGFGFQGNGVLGKFEPAAPPAGQTRVVVLDTASQSFPLSDGSTPDAPPYFVVTGGVFSFTDVDIPAGVVVQPQGPNPLVITATGSVHVAGSIVLDGQYGSPESQYNSATTSVPGGTSVCGGGAGGEGEPLLFYPAAQVGFRTKVSPSYGGQGFGVDPADGRTKRIGGFGGQCGALDQKDASGNYATDHEMACNAFRGAHGSEKPPGGGGGAMLRPGLAPSLYSGGVRIGNADGVGNVLPDGTGNWIANVGGYDDQVLLAGAAGRWPFFDDGDALNDFFGPRGQLQRLVGGQGGGAGASLCSPAYYCGTWCRVDASSADDAVCDASVFGFGSPFSDEVANGRGGGGGGGGGALCIQALGAIVFESTARLSARGGIGGGGQAIGCSYFSGGGGGGAGGAIVVQSATSVLVNAGAVIDVSGGAGDKATDKNYYFNCDNGKANGNAGDGGAGGDGLVQLQVPRGATATVVDASQSVVPPESWVDPGNVLAPADFAPTSVALSKWYDLGRVTTRAPIGTNPVFACHGLDANGFVLTDANGSLVAPDTSDVVCGYLGRLEPVTQAGYVQGEEPRDAFVPTNATVRVEFQSADAIVAGSKEVDPATLSAWSGSPSIADGRQFLRWRVTFDLTADGSTISPTTHRPVVESLRVPVEF